jgi:hypothetical protein
MARRAAHGRARALGAAVVYETLPTDELPPPQAVGPDPLLSGRDPKTKRVMTSEAASAMARLPRASRMVPRNIACHPEFAKHNDRRLEWKAGRTAEIQAAHGGVSRGVGARLNAAAWANAAADFANELGAAKGDLKAFAQAGALAAHAKTLDDSAWELAALEAKKRKATEKKVPLVTVLEGGAQPPEEDDS